MPRTSALSLTARLRRVRWLLCDVDGVLTDGRVWIGQDFEAKAFDIQDGMGLAMLRRAGLKCGWVSSRPSPATARRAAELRVDWLHQAKTPKCDAIAVLLAREGCAWEEVCYVGDDVVDLAPMRRAGVAVAVANAVAEVKRRAHRVTRASGGAGAVREVVEMLLRAQGRWGKMLATFDA